MEVAGQIKRVQEQGTPSEYSSQTEYHPLRDARETVVASRRW